MLMSPLNGVNKELTGRVSLCADRAGGVMAAVSVCNYTLSHCILAAVVGEQAALHVQGRGGEKGKIPAPPVLPGLGPHPGALMELSCPFLSPLEQGHKTHESQSPNIPVPMYPHLHSSPLPHVHIHTCPCPCTPPSLCVPILIHLHPCVSPIPIRPRPCASLSPHVPILMCPCPCTSSSPLIPIPVSPNPMCPHPCTPPLPHLPISTHPHPCVSPSSLISILMCAHPCTSPSAVRAAAPRGDGTDLLDPSMGQPCMAPRGDTWCVPTSPQSSVLALPRGWALLPKVQTF